ATTPVRSSYSEAEAVRRPFLIAVMGPTGSGKSAVAEEIADRTGAQLVSADAFMVYRGLDVGTNKPADTSRYELIDVVGPEEPFGVGKWVSLASDVLAKTWEEGRSAVVVGGTGLYVRALFEQYDDLKPAPEPNLRAELGRREREEGLEALVQELIERDPGAEQSIDLRNPARVRRALERLADDRPAIKVALPPYVKAKFALNPPKQALEARLEERAAQMFDSGWPEEVAGLLNGGVQRCAPAFRAIGYDCIVDLLDGKLSRDEAVQRVVAKTRQYAKRQRTWLRSEPGAVLIPVGQSIAEHGQRATEEIMSYLISLESQDG
ncbi:MAG: tRNA (adenosine(37)-N6)-dimethylallyltransferase MiaA, partial [Armatimonadetes bacterium]|nr:tRNA (adenosine(37)-N6)-dimethylallyltransferase MiaA [Armatimonadota bacterium]